MIRSALLNVLNYGYVIKIESIGRDQSISPTLLPSSPLPVSGGGMLEAQRGYSMPATTSASCRSRQSRRATILPSRTVNTV